MGTKADSPTRGSKPAAKLCAFGDQGHLLGVVEAPSGVRVKALGLDCKDGLWLSGSSVGAGDSAFLTSSWIVQSCGPQDQQERPGCSQQAYLCEPSGKLPREMLKEKELGVSRL